MNEIGLKMLLGEMEISLNELKEITDKIEKKKLTSKDIDFIETRLIIDTFVIRRTATLISTFIADFVDNLNLYLPIIRNYF